MVKKITEFEIIRLYLYDYSKRYYLREMASALGKPHQTIKPYVERLAKERILIKNQRKNLTEYFLNIKDKRITEYLVIAEKKKLIERLNQDALMLALYERVWPFFTQNTFVVFGSATEDTRTAGDIDLLILGKKNLAGQLREFEMIYNKKIHAISAAKLHSLTSTFKREIFAKHIILNNTEGLIRFFGEHDRTKLV